jgi:hypothetical protein
MSEPIVMGLVGVVVLVLLTGLGIPIAFAITLVGAVGMLISSDVNYTRRCRSRPPANTPSPSSRCSC